MCGILGGIGITDQPLFEKALERLAHRGPDGKGIWKDDTILIGHRRLAIIDITDKGSQPMELQGRYVITYNGEIYNYKEIRVELEKNGFRFIGNSDTEVLLNAYIQWKEQCLLKFNGMWALAIWDKKEKTLFLTRDRFGKKPLFYSIIKNDQFVFASEMKAIAPFLDQVEASDDFEWFGKNIFRYEGTDKCLINGIKRFPGGHYGIWKNGELMLHRYWNTLEHINIPPKKYEDQVEQFREIFVDACRIRMRSDVPLGTALSGGVDSSAALCVMAHIGHNEPDAVADRDWQNAFIATFPGTELDESYFAQRVIDHTGINATFIPVDPIKTLDKLGEYLYMFEELYITSPIPMVELYKSIKQNGVTVSIDGHGADELLAGYYKDIFRAFRDCGFNIRKIKNLFDTYYDAYGDIKKYDLDLYLRFLGNKRAAILYFLRELAGKNPKDNAANKKFGAFNQYLFEIFHQTILPTLLRNYDHYSMSHGVEIRMPFIDHRLVSFCFSLPWTSKLRNGYTKSILRDALAGFMPEEIAWRKDKIGFNTPMKEWMSSPWKSYIMDTIHSRSFKESGFVSADETIPLVTKVINKPETDYMDGDFVWEKIMPFLWEQHVLKKY